MHFCSIVSQAWKTTAKTVLNTICLLFVFFVSANNVWSEITIHAGSWLNWTLELTNPNLEPLRLGKFEKFTATAFRSNPHPFQLAPDVDPDPKFGYIEFSATGEAKLPLFTNPKKGCGLSCDEPSVTRSIRYKWDEPGFYIVTAQVYDEMGMLHASVDWHVQVGKSTFVRLPDPPSDPSAPDPPSAQVSPEPGEYTVRVGSDMQFEIQVASDDGIASIALRLYEDGMPPFELIKKAESFRFPKGSFGVSPPSLTATHTWKTLGNHLVTALITTQNGGSREVTWRINIKEPNPPPMRIANVPLVDLGALRVGGELGMVHVSEYFSDPEGESLVFDEVIVDASTADIVTLMLLENSDGYKSTISIEPAYPGRAVFSAIAREQDGLPAAQSFTVLVEPEQDVPAQREPETEVTIVQPPTPPTSTEVPDLRIDSVRVNKITVAPGENFRLDATVENQGEADANGITIRYYQSTDETISSDDTQLKTGTLYTIPINVTREPWAQLTAPETPGVYYYGVCVDAADEIDISNNCSTSVAVTVVGEGSTVRSVPVNETSVARGEDLFVASVQVTPANAVLAPGERFQIETLIRNRGSVSSSATTLRYYLSTDETISPEDTEVASDRVDSLSGRGASANRRKTEISRTLTVPDTLGSYYYGVCIDAGENESNISNNCSEAIAITVEAPPSDPVASGTPEPAVRPEGPDLVISAARVERSALQLGEGVRLYVTLENRGKRAAPAATLRYYRSLDATISPEDTELRAVPIGDLGAGRIKATWASLPTPISLGVYYFGACLDGVASEADTLNNCSDAFEITIGPQMAEVSGILLSDAIPVQALDVEGSPVTLNVAENFRGRVQSYIASSSDTNVVTAAMSGSKVTLMPVSSGWAYVTIQVFRDDFTTRLGFSVSVGDPGVPNPHVVPDANLSFFIREALELEENQPITRQQLKKLTRLNIVPPEQADSGEWNTGIRDLTGLEYASNLRALYLYKGEVRDITQIKNLTSLTFLGFTQNKISDIAPIKNLNALRELHLWGNQISDISPLANLTNLRILYITGNQISSVTVLENLTGLTQLGIHGNPITDWAPVRRLKEKGSLSYLDISLPPAGEAPSAPAVPNETALLSNYPNPFNPETWIPYQLAKSADVTLTIYDVTGVVVRQLALGHQPAGFYQSRGRAAHWDGRNALGERVATGLYFCTFTAGDFTATQKLLIRK